LAVDPRITDRITAAAITIRDITTTIDRIIIAPTTIAVTTIIIADTTGGIIGTIAIDHPEGARAALLGD
jgi:hypothetical protein